MKYDNYKKVNEIVGNIEKLQVRFDAMNSDQVSIEVRTPGKAAIMTVGAWPGCEHPYTREAIKFIDAIKIDLQNSINHLKGSLRDL